MRGVVLTGGHSLRMGTDKAVLPVAGIPLALRVAGALAAAGCNPVVCQGGDATVLQALGLAVRPDSDPGSGPAFAYDALAGAAPDDVVVSACDLPWLDADTVRALVRAAGTHPDRVVVVATVDGHAQLVGVWRSAATEQLTQLLTSGLRAYRAVVQSLDAVTVEVAARSVVNVNRPGDLP